MGFLLALKFWVFVKTMVIVKIQLIFSFCVDFILIFLQNYGTIIVLDNFINLNGLYVGKNVGLARHIRSGVKLSSNNERNCVFRCVVSTTHLCNFRRI